MAEKKKAENMKTFYHYTSEENADAIRKDGVIEPSQKGAYGGDKVYLTDIPPSAGRKAIAKNNYDDRMNWEHREAQGAVDRHIKVKLPESQVKKEDDTAGRHIYTHKGPVKLPKSK